MGAIRVASLAIVLAVWQIGGARVDPVLFTTPQAVANAALVYPASIRYFGPDAKPCAGAIYGDRTFLESVGCTIAEPAIEAQLRFAAPLTAGGSHRREIAARARSFSEARIQRALVGDVMEHEPIQHNLE